ncbi:MAG: glycosyltransferase [Vicinamibacteria bacterium]|nr:glycosyltransferase [Vicinamibacteria bacterium]
MIGLALLVSGALLAIAGGHLVAALWFAVRTRREVEPTNGPWPRAAILMTLRGADPSLGATLRSLLTQDYPQYHIYIALDRPDDPARNAVEEALLEGAGRVSVSIREPNTVRCTLACAASSQLLRSLDDSCGVVVITDGDTQHDPGWLKRLVGPLADPKVGIVSGQSWFEPSEDRFAALVRSAWYAGALVVATARGYPCGASMAIRLSDAKRARLAERWQQAAVADGAARAAICELGLEVRIEPALTTVNREDCSGRFTYGFVRRQLKWSGHYYDGFLPVLGLSVWTVVLLAAEAGLAFRGILEGNRALAGIAATTLIVFHLLHWMSFLLVRRVVRDVLSGRIEAWPSLRGLRALKLFLSVAVCTPLTAVAALSAYLDRRVTWRQAEYEIRGPYDVRVVSAPPFQQPLSDGRLSQ